MISGTKPNFQNNHGMLSNRQEDPVNNRK